MCEPLVRWVCGLLQLEELIYPFIWLSFHAQEPGLTSTVLGLPKRISRTKAEE